MNTVTIVGVGLIGGSFGLALRAAGFEGDLIGVSSRAALEAGLKAGAITHCANLREAAAAADLIYLAQPVDRILSTIEELQSLVRPHTTVTDAGSTKRAIVAKAEECLSTAYFVGGHPMAGKEQRGVEAAEADLFRSRPYILTTPAVRTRAFDELKSWLERIGSEVIEMSPEAHDETVSFTSHLPQLVSTALAVTLASKSTDRALDVFGPGLLDMTRLAMSSPDLWTPILSTNREAVGAALQHYKSALSDLQLALENDSLVELFEVGSAWAKQLRRAKPGA